MAIEGFGGPRKAVNGSAQSGIASVSGAVVTQVMVNGTSISNSGTGLLQSGAGASLRLGSSVITGDATGVSGNVLSYLNNQLNGNASDGTLTPIARGLH